MNKLWTWIAGAVFAVATFAAITTYIETRAVTDTLNEIQIEQLESNQEIRDGVRDAIKEVEESNPESDPTISLDSLRRWLDDRGL